MSRPLTVASAGTGCSGNSFFLSHPKEEKDHARQIRRHPDDRGQDLDRARKFYEEKLGLKQVDDFGEGFMLKSGDTKLSVYRSEYAGTNKATALTFDVDDIQEEVRGLKDKGIAFEHYDLEGLKANGDIYEGEGMKTAWFKDPDGNILSLIEAD